MSAQYGNVTIDGFKSSGESAYSLLGQGYGNTGYPVYGGVAADAFVFYLQNGVSTTGGSTIWFNTDWDSTTGYNGYEYNVRLTDLGAFLYTGSDGQTLVTQLTDYVKTPGSPDYSNVEFALPSALLAGAPQSAMIATTINGYTSKHALAPSVPPGAVYGSVTLDGNLSEWTSADYLGSHNGTAGFDLYARFTGDALVLAIMNPGDPIGEYSTIWFNTDMNTSTGMNVYGNKLIGAEDYIFFENSGLPVFHNRILDYAYNATRDMVEIAIPVELIGPSTFETYFAMHAGRYWGTALYGSAFTFTVPGSSPLPQPPSLNVVPVITSNGGEDSAAISIAENSTAVVSITATDANVDQILTYTITGGADASQFAINATTGALSFLAAPDFESPADVGGNNVYDLIVGVSDGNGGSDNQTIALTVTNVNGVNISGSSYGRTHTGTGEADTIRGGGGNDTINGLGGNDMLAGDSGNDIVNGGDGNDTINGGSGSDTLNGDAGDDIINGGASRDVMTGGSGFDRFAFSSASDAGNSASSRDVITDFVSGVDKIDVSAIDNNVNASGNGAFTFLAAAGATFTAPGQIRYRYDTSTGTEHTIIEGSNDQDSAAEFQIDLISHANLVATDFIL